MLAAQFDQSLFNLRRPQGLFFLAVKFVVVVAVVIVSAATNAMIVILACVVSFGLALAVVSPASAGALALSADIAVGSETEAIYCAATGVSGPVLCARRGPGSGSRVPTLTAAPQESGGIVINASCARSRT